MKKIICTLLVTFLAGCATPKPTVEGIMCAPHSLVLIYGEIILKLDCGEIRLDGGTPHIKKPSEIIKLKDVPKLICRTKQGASEEYLICKEPGTSTKEYP